MQPRTLRAAPLCATLLLLLALPRAARAQAQNCVNPVEKCDPNTDQFPSDERISIEYARETIPELVYSNVYVDFTVNFTVSSIPKTLKYRLVRCGCEAPSAEDRATIYTSPESIYIDDSIGIAMIDVLDPELTPIKYIKSASSKYNKDLRDKVKAGVIEEKNVTDLAESTTLSAFVLNSFEGGSASATSNPPVLIAAELDERSPISRAEWIKLYGLYLNRETQANSLFKNIVADYNAVVGRAKAATRRPSVFFNTPWPTKANMSVPFNERYGWAQPGGNTYMSHYMRDANADYRLRNDGKEGSETLTLDEIKGNFSSAHFLLNADHYPNAAGRNMKDFVTMMQEGDTVDPEMESFMKNLTAVRCGNVISRALRVVQNTAGSSAIDFFGKAAVRPDLLLKDYVKMLHPNVDIGGHNPVFVYAYSEDRSLGLACPFASLLGEPRPGSVYVDKKLEIKGLNRYDVQDALEPKVFPELENRGVSVNRTDFQFPDAGNANEKTTILRVRREVAEDKKGDAEGSLAVLLAFRAALGDSVEVEDTDKGGGLSSSAIIGIVTGCVFGVLLAILAVIYFQKSKATKPDQYAEMEAAGEHPVTS